MGKIFGISDNPVSTIESALKGYNSVEPPFPREILKKKSVPADKFILSGKKNISNPVPLKKNVILFFRNLMQEHSRHSAAVRAMSNPFTMFIRF